MVLIISSIPSVYHVNLTYFTIASISIVTNSVQNVTDNKIMIWMNYVRRHILKHKNARYVLDDSKLIIYGNKRSKW